MTPILKRTLPLLVALAVAASATADERFPYGRWAIGIDTAHSIIGESDEDDAVQVDQKAPGGGFQAGYMVSPKLMVRMYVAGAEHPTNLEDTDLLIAGGSFDLVAFLGGHPRFRPYLFGGLGGFEIESQQPSLTLSTEGVAVAFGAGCHYHLGGLISLHGSARVEAINWQKSRATLYFPNGTNIVTETAVSESGTAAKLTLGVAFWL